MSSAPDRRLVVNADDLGRSQAINAGVLHGHVHGIVTSASLMVRHPSAAQAVDDARAHPDLGLGLHVDLAEWEQTGGEGRAKYTVVDIDDRRAVAREVDRQIESFRSLVGSAPTHLDSHQHVHREEPVRSVALEAATALGVPLRGHGVIEYCGAFYGQDRDGSPLRDAITSVALGRVVRGLPPGVTELGCHPATVAESFTSYSTERPLELQALCDASVRDAILECRIGLCNFAELKGLGSVRPPGSSASARPPR